METMSSLSYKVYSPSYKRSDIARTHLLFHPETFCYVVREEEAELYAHLGVELVLIPRGTVDSISTTRNWILKNKKHPYIVMVDDDFSAINRLVLRKPVAQDPDQIHEMIHNGFSMAIDAGVSLWGINVNSDPITYSINKPFQFSRIVLGPFLAVVDPAIEFDTRFKLKEDYDYFLQHLRKSRKVLRLDMYSYACDHIKLKGGLQTIRTKELETFEAELLRKKWGDIVCANTQFKNSINLTVKTVI